MRYFYEPDTHYTLDHGCIYSCNHPLYNTCTLYLTGKKGLAVVQQRFNKRLKVTFWSHIDLYLVDDIYLRPGFKDILESNAGFADNGLYPTVGIRKLMWALKMKPLIRYDWETDPPSQFLQRL